MSNEEGVGLAEKSTQDGHTPALGWSAGVPSLKDPSCCCRISAICGCFCLGVVALVVIFLIHVIAAGAQFQPDCDRSVYDPTILATHRGDIRGGQENSYDAVNATYVNPDTSMAEVDVRLSSDGVVVLFHDNNTQWLTGVDNEIESMTWEEIQELEFLEEIETGSYNKTRPIERLDTVLDIFCPLGLDFMFDIKDPVLLTRNRPLHAALFETIDAAPCDDRDLLLAVGNPSMAHDLYQRNAAREAEGKRKIDVLFYYVDKNQVPPNNAFWRWTRYFQWLSESHVVFNDWFAHSAEEQKGFQEEGYCYGLFNITPGNATTVDDAEFFVVDY